MERFLTYTIHVPGTLTANITPCFTAPVDMTLLHISAGGSNANDGTIKAGTVASDAAYLAAASIGDSNNPVEFGRSSFVGGQYPRISAGDDILITVDYDGAAGTATANLTVVLTCLAG